MLEQDAQRILNPMYLKVALKSCLLRFNISDSEAIFLGTLNLSTLNNAIVSGLRRGVALYILCVYPFLLGGLASKHCQCPKGCLAV